MLRPYFQKGCLMAYVFDKVIESQVTPVIDDDAYTAGDVVGGLITFNVSSPSGCGIINAMRIADDDDEKAVLTLYVFNAAPTTIADDAAFAPTIADLKKLVAKIEIAADDYTSISDGTANNAYALKQDLNEVYKADGKGNLYGYLVCTATPTYTAATDLTIILSVLTS